MKGISFKPNTNFYNELDYPVFKNHDKLFVMEVYANDNSAVCHELRNGHKALYGIRDFEFIGWLEDIRNKNPEYFV